MSDHVTIIITTKNNEDIILNCLSSIKKQTCKATLSIIIADDNSSDKTELVVKAFDSKILFLKIKKKKGPAYNRNIALKYVKSEYILFMDSDCKISEDWIKNSLKIFKNFKNLGFLGGKIFFDEECKEIQSCGGEFDIGGTGWLSKDTNLGSRECFWLPSSCFMTKKSILDTIGGFDADYFYQYEDLDICWRANIMGFKVFYTDNLVAFHLLSYSVKKNLSNKFVTYHSKKNKIMTLIKNLESISFFKFFFWILIVSICELIFLREKTSIFNGNFVYPIKNYKLIMNKRHKVLQNRKLKDNEIAKYFFKSRFKLILICLGLIK